MTMTPTEVWIATSDGRDMIRADAIVIVRQDAVGRLTAQLRDEARVSVTLLDGSAGMRPPDDFNRSLIRTIAELSDGSGARLVRAHHDEQGWRWVTEPL